MLFSPTIVLRPIQSQATCPTNPDLLTSPPLICCLYISHSYYPLTLRIPAPPTQLFTVPLPKVSTSFLPPCPEKLLFPTSLLSYPIPFCHQFPFLAVSQPVSTDLSQCSSPSSSIPSEGDLFTLLKPKRDANVVLETAELSLLGFVQKGLLSWVPVAGKSHLAEELYHVHRRETHLRFSC